jgi:predicted phage terminase large subunit-like protein
MNAAPPISGLAILDADDHPVVRLADLLVEQICRYSPEARSFRRSGSALDLLAWGRQFLPAHFRYPPSAMHRWLADQLEHAGVQRGAKINVLAPRGGAKSTVAALAYLLRSAVEGREPYAWIVSATKEQAQLHLEHIKAELEMNPRLLAAYPHAVGRGRHWRRGAIELLNGVMIEAYSVGQQLRGRRRREHRPTLIVCDDLENDRRAMSRDQRAVCRDWFHGVLLNAGDVHTNVVHLATALHREALALRLHESPGWTSGLFRAIERWPDNVHLWREWERIYCDRTNPRAPFAADEYFEQHRDALHAGAKLLWPEKESLYDLMKLRVAEGRTAFEREKQNAPLDPARCEWPAEYFDHHIWFRHWPEELIVKAMALDPSKGVDARHGDYSAYVLLGIDKHGVIYVEADLNRRATPKMVYDGVSLCARFCPHVFAVEASQFQDLLVGEFAQEFKRRKTRVTQPVPLSNYVNKLVRIRTLGSLLSEQRIRFLTESPSTQMLVDQMRDFPLGDFDDGPDALEMAFRVAQDYLSAKHVPDDGLGDRLIP